MINTPQRCELCEGEFKRPKIVRLPNYHYVCKTCIELTMLIAIREKDERN